MLGITDVRIIEGGQLTHELEQELCLSAARLRWHAPKPSASEIRRHPLEGGLRRFPGDHASVRAILGGGGADGSRALIRALVAAIYGTPRRPGHRAAPNRA